MRAGGVFGRREPGAEGTALHQEPASCRRPVLAPIHPVLVNPAVSSSAGAPATKRVLVIHYSQTGQLSAVIEQIVAPLAADARISVHIETLKPLPGYPFPWPYFRFFDAFPESAHMVPPALAPLSLSGDEHFDLVILPYQVWFLAPSLPITAFLKHPVGRKLLAGKPVVTVIACRNMWMLAQEKLKALLASAGARLIDNVVLTDPGPTLATFITTPRWLLTGRKAGFWGMPDAGVSPAQIRGTRRFGLALRDAMHQGLEQQPGPLLSGLAAVQVEPHLYISEKAGTRGFYLWGALLAFYSAFLVVAIVTIVPASLALQALLRPFLRGWLHRIKQQFELPSGSGTDRLASYE